MLSESRRVPIVCILFLDFARFVIFSWPVGDRITKSHRNV